MIALAPPALVAALLLAGIHWLGGGGKATAGPPAGGSGPAASMLAPDQSGQGSGAYNQNPSPFDLTGAFGAQPVMNPQPTSSLGNTPASASSMPGGPGEAGGSLGGEPSGGAELSRTETDTSSPGSSYGTPVTTPSPVNQNDFRMGPTIRYV